MKILFALSSPEYLRFYDETIGELARRGHDLTIAVHIVREGKPVRLTSIEGVHREVAVAGLVPTREDLWRPLTRAIRGTMDFVRYFHPELARASALRARVKRQALPWPLQPMDRIASIETAGVERLMRCLARLERAVPVARETTQFLETHRPDLVLVSPLVELASDQVDLVRSAKALGIPVGALIASWDNLTNKGDLRVATDRVFVWNEAQRREAVTLHRMDAARVVVTGAPVFDRWFGREPTRARGEFCRMVGLPSDAPFVLFTGSSIFIARAENEIPFIRTWIEALRASGDPAVRRLGVLVRPHPYNGRAWPADALTDLDNVAVWPKGGYDPIDDANRAGFFDSMYHAAAVVGINTSAMIESAVVGRPVLSILAPEFVATQGGTLHFHHLLPENGGFLRVAGTLAEHVRQLGGVLANPAEVRAEIARFVATFVRPGGIDRPATPMLADALEALGRAPALAPVRITAADRIWQAALLPAAWIARWCPPEAERRSVLGRVKRDVGLWGVRTRRATRKAVVPTWRATASAAVHGPARVRGSAVKAARVALVRPLRRAWRGTFRLLRLVVTTPARHARRAVRLAWYHAAVLARRVRGVPSE